MQIKLVIMLIITINRVNNQAGNLPVHTCVGHSVEECTGVDDCVDLAALDYTFGSQINTPNYRYRFLIVFCLALAADACLPGLLGPEENDLASLKHRAART